MNLSALRTNFGKCPYWNVSIGVSGLYGEEEDGHRRFIRAVCPIVENSKLPVYEQAVEYKYMRCSDPHSCHLYTQFQPSITSDK